MTQYNDLLVLIIAEGKRVLISKVEAIDTSSERAFPHSLYFSYTE